MMFDAAVLARGWLSVALASGKDSDRPILDRTVHIEHHPGGLRLVATDSYMLLHAFVPDVDHEYDAAPGIDEVPIATATARDPYGRGRGFLGHVLRLASGDDAAPIEIRVRLNVMGDAKPQGAFAGMEAHHVVLEQPDVERLVLDVVDGPYPSWRPLLAGVTPVPTNRVALSPSIVGRLAKVEKFQPLARIGWTFAGEARAARVDLIDSDPYVDGIVMPCRWDFATNAPAVDATPADDDQGAELDGQTAINHDGAPTGDPADLQDILGRKWTTPRQRALEVVYGAFPAVARIGMGMWSDDGPPTVSPAGGAWLVGLGLAVEAGGGVVLTPLGCEAWEALGAKV